VSRALGANKLYYSGQKDSSMDESVCKIVKDFGGNFNVEYIKDYIHLIESKKKNGFKVIHLTAYGQGLKSFSKTKGEDIFVIVGGEKVPKEVFDLVDYNLAITNQPHSEVSALGIFLYEYQGSKILTKDFKNFKLKIIPQKNGKKVLEK